MGHGRFHKKNVYETVNRTECLESGRDKEVEGW